MKSLLQSKTLWLAVLQSMVAVIVIFESHYQLGGLLIVKSIADIAIRFMTTQPIK